MLFLLYVIPILAYTRYSYEWLPSNSSLLVIRFIIIYKFKFLPYNTRRKCNDTTLRFGNLLPCFCCIIGVSREATIRLISEEDEQNEGRE